MRVRDPEKLKFALQHSLFYELWMLGATHAQLQKPATEAVISNALIESFCIHARLLLEFFDGKQGVRAYEYTGGSYQPQYNVVLGEKLIGQLRVKLNEQIAHLSANRDSAEKINRVERALLLEAIVQEVAHFFTKLDPAFASLIRVEHGETAAVRASNAPGATNQIDSVTVVVPLHEPGN